MGATHNNLKHVAVIMDGNGRWAAARGLPRFQGHLEGVKRVEEIVDVANSLGLEVLTLFAFSTENWHRPRQEVGMLMDTLCRVLDKKLGQLVKGNVRLNVIGRRDGVSPEVLASLDRCREKTKTNDGMVLNLAFNYGARIEILDAVKDICRSARDGQLELDAIDEDLFSRHLYTHDLPDPDLLIRTSGEQRISNFLLWQLSYAELYFTDKFWPDFKEQEFRDAVNEYLNRERRYGRVTAPVKP